ncbi:MAG: domain S-box [Verrucomicrobiaceae bacterium]|nr:domain S-box [Verrucomicrobiaceae bacterium]
MLSWIKRVSAFKPHRGALRIAFVYAAAGVLWITFSDQAIARFISTRALAEWIATVKGYGYVAVTSVLLYVAIWRLHAQHRLTQAHLQRSERAYRTMFNDNPNPMLVYDPHTLRFLEVNRAAIAKYGYTRDEFLALTLRDIRPPEAQAQFQRDLDASKHFSDFLVAGPVPHQTKQHVVLNMEVTISTLRMQSRDVQLMMAQDISLRVQAERELLESRRQLKEAQRIAGFGSWSVEHDSGALTFSSQMYQLLGIDVDAQTWTMQTLFQFVHPDDRAALQKGYDDAWRGQPLQIELRLLRASGDIHYVLMRGEQVARADRARQLMGTILDVDERKRYEKKLQDSERQYRQLIDNLPEAVMIYGDGKVIFANPVAATLFGATTPDQLLGFNVEDFIATPSKTAARSRLEWLQGGVDRTDSHFRERLLRKLDGEIFAAEVAARSTMMNGAHCIQVLVRDISDQKKSQQDLRQANERLLHLSTHMLEAAEDERRHLSRELHDDLGQSLTFIKMTAAWLRKRLQHDELSERITQVHVAAGEALEKVRNLALALRPAQLDGLGLKAAMEDHLHKYCDGSGVDYAARLEDLQPRPDPDIETAVFRIFQEAVTNIFRHSGASFIEIELARRDGVIELRVVDDGRGFDVEEAFARGANLGLHTMRERAQQLRGEVRVHSVVGAGTEMSVTIPEQVL